jgi:hypothetical protein
VKRAAFAHDISKHCKQCVRIGDLGEQVLSTMLSLVAEQGQQPAEVVVGTWEGG